MKQDWSGGLCKFFSAAAKPRLRRLVLFARIALLVERLARALAPAVVVTGLFIALSWTGIWLGASAFSRLAGAAFFLCLLVAALTRLRRFSFPSAEEARVALDAHSADAPAATLADALANGGDPQTRQLWGLHLRRAEKTAADLRHVRPAPRLWRADRHAVGALAVLALCAGALLAGPEKYARIAAAFDWRRSVSEGGSSRIDAWIDPPAYTGKPPIVLPLNNSGEKLPTMTAPVGSTIVVRASDADLRIVDQGGVEPSPAAGVAPPAGERRFVLRGDGTLKLMRGASQLALFSLHGVPDAPPTITPLGTPETNLHGSFVIGYRIDDDYGARDAHVSARPALGGPPPEGHALVPPPNAPLELPAAPGGLGEGHSTIDWTDSPYAGARVDLELRVRDEGGNEGQSVLQDFALPKKQFNNPLARALAEQRRLLALDSGQKDKVLSAVDALMVAPELFTPNLGVYLGLRFAHTSLRRARNDSDLVAATDFLWNMALRIEEGDAPQAERDLRAAQKALREALNRNASPEEIARLTKQLQKAMDAFLAEMRKNAAKKALSNESETGEGRTITPKDLKSMLDQLTEAAKEGDKNAALDLLDQMQNMLENLRSAKKAGAGQAAQDRRNLRDIDKMMREQQKLRDDTYARQRGEPTESETAPEALPGDKKRGGGKEQPKTGSEKPGARGQEQGSPDTPSQEALDERQQQLRDQLEALQKRTERSGAPAPKGLNDADEAMGQAENALKKGDASAALDAQGRALEGLRKGAGEMSAQARQGEGAPGEDEGQSEQKEGKMGGQNGEGSIFGRPNGQNNAGATAAHKARKVLEELRRRLSDPNRARDELDYLERLIKPD